MTVQSAAQRDPCQEEEREKDTGQDSHFQIISQMTGYKASQSGADGAAYIAAKRQKGEESSSSPGEGGGCLAEGAGPQDPHGEPAEGAGYQVQPGEGQKSDA